MPLAILAILQDLYLVCTVRRTEFKRYLPSSSVRTIIPKSMTAAKIDTDISISVFRPSRPCQRSCSRTIGKTYPRNNYADLASAELEKILADKPITRVNKAKESRGVITKAPEEEDDEGILG